MGITIHRILNQPQNPQILAADFRNFGLVKVRFFVPLTTYWGTLPCGTYNRPRDIKEHWRSRVIFVANTNFHHIVRLKPTNQHPASWGCEIWGGPGSGPVQFNEPVALAIENESGDIYVSDKGNNRIQKLNDRKEFIDELDSFWASGMVVDFDNNVYASVPALNKVVKFTPKFDIIPEWDPPVNEFNSPIGIAVDHNNDVYVVNSGTQEVKVFNKKGELHRSWGGAGNTLGKFKFPYGITYDFNTRIIYVSDNRQHSIQVFREDGTPLDTKLI